MYEKETNIFLASKQAQEDVGVGASEDSGIS